MARNTAKEPNATPITSLDKLIADGILTARNNFAASTDDRHFLMSDEYRAEITAAVVLSEEYIGLASDWVTIDSKSSGWTNYGRIMYSPSLNRLRYPLFHESYDGEEVD